MLRELRIQNQEGHVICVHECPSAMDKDAWNTLLASQNEPTPFMRWEYLVGLYTSGCTTASTGWLPRFVTVENRGRLVAAAPTYLKSHSYGEYVFDWAWAEAYQQHGLAYYPKLVVAVPFTPVPGARLMAIDPSAHSALVQGLRELAKASSASSIHVLFHPDCPADKAMPDEWSKRIGVQFHWTQRSSSPWPDFSSFLASMQREKRKKIQQERRRVVDQGITFSTHEGTEITPELWRFFHRCYSLTYRAHHSKPYLNLKFFESMAAELPTNWLMFVAHREGQPIGVSLVVIDRATGQAWGRYWGCTEFVPCLHFEACYYQPLQWCLAHGFVRFEGGAQGEHKMARGLLPVSTRSSHWLDHPEFARAVQNFLEREGQGMASYVDELREHSPFKALA